MIPGTSGGYNIMQGFIATLLDRYESGQVSRRQLIQTLAAVSLTASGTSAAGSTFKGAGLNHIAVRVADIPRTRAFYQELLGLPLISESASSCFLQLGGEFLTFFKNSTPGLDHYCIAIEDFSPDEVMERLAARGLSPRRPSGTNRIYFRDPDGLEVQLSAIDHRA
jgi:catechol 2,3-dioxygenase-like lactoylglutathione lyase family enzyme